jgi:hypothetical protein
VSGDDDGREVARQILADVQRSSQLLDMAPDAPERMQAVQQAHQEAVAELAGLARRANCPAPRLLLDRAASGAYTRITSSDIMIDDLGLLMPAGMRSALLAHELCHVSSMWRMRLTIMGPAIALLLAGASGFLLAGSSSALGHVLPTLTIVAALLALPASKMAEELLCDRRAWRLTGKPEMIALIHQIGGSGFRHILQGNPPRALRTALARRAARRMGRPVLPLSR